MVSARGSGYDLVNRTVENCYLSQPGQNWLQAGFDRRTIDRGSGLFEVSLLWWISSFDVHNDPVAGYSATVRDDDLLLKYDDQERSG